MQEHYRSCGKCRHTITHNVGVITGSDAGKFKMLVKADVESSRILNPGNHDIIYVKRFLSETAQSVNRSNRQSPGGGPDRSSCR